MSLTTFLADEEVRRKFSLEFSMTKVTLKSNILAVPITKNYSLVGTAFDYLMRFYIERMNSNSIIKPWVAEDAVELTKINRNLFKKCNDILTEAKNHYINYKLTGRMNDNLFRASLLLAQLDPIFRAGVVDPNLGNVDEGDIRDLKNLIRIVKPEYFKSKNICLLNPTFGEASELVGGADADLIIDDTLIDIKTTKKLEFTRQHLNQLIGYYILLKIGNVDRLAGADKISKLGIYYSRYGLIHTVSTTVVERKDNLKEFILWFKKKAISLSSEK